MPAVYAVLGATGTVGSEVLRYLLKNSEHPLRLLVRSKDKLIRQLPDLDSTYGPRITIYEADISDGSVLKACVAGTNAAFLCVAVSTNQPGARIAQKQSESIVTALQAIRDNDPLVKLPRLIVLSSAETEPKFCEEIPWPVQAMLFKAHSNIYNDLIAAEQYLRRQEEWITSIFVKPGALSHDISRGHEIVEDRQQSFLSYFDLAGAMVEIAEQVNGKWDNKTVSVTSPGGKAKTEPAIIQILLRGLLCHYFPWMWHYFY